MFLLSFLIREDQVNFRGFMRTLAHFRPIEDNEKSKDVNGPEPLNSRSNKLHCKEIVFRLKIFAFLHIFLTNHLFIHSFTEQSFIRTQWLRAQTLELNRLDLNPSTATFSCDFGQVTSNLWTAVSFSVEWDIKRFHTGRL